MVTVAKDDVLARVDADLTNGHTYPALQRLASLSAEYPDDLGIRALRGRLNRQIGNLVEAGRWSFLTEDPLPEELAAFTRRYPYAWARLRALHLRTDPSDALGVRGRQRLADLREQAQREGAAPVVWQPPSRHQRTTPGWADRVGCLVAGLLVLIPLGLMVLGLVTLIRLIL
jgi:hypothetical protein